jgi:tetratricopeptide (TPR) repeat protein
MSPWHRNEYILKGLFLGLWVFFALQVPAEPRAARIDILWVVGWVLAGLILAVIGGTVLQLSRGLRPGHNWLAFPLVVLLESPTFIYAGILGGVVVGVLSGTLGAEPWASQLAGYFGLSFDDIKHLTSANLANDDPNKGNLPGDWLTYCVLGGIILGFGLYRFRQVDDPSWRFWGGMALTAIVMYLAGHYIDMLPGFEDKTAQRHLGWYILLGLPFFYLLVFCADADESIADVMAWCAMLGVGLQLWIRSRPDSQEVELVAYLVAVLLYFLYATRFLYPLSVFKHVVRGFAYLNVDQLRLALGFFRRALELDPNNPLAKQGLLALHTNLTLTKLDNDPELVESLDFGLCLDRAASLLAQPPTVEQRTEAERFLDLVERKKPTYQARVDYLRVIALLHAKQHDAAADLLARLLNPETPGYHPTVRKQVLFDAWDLALRLHPRLVERLGWAELNKPGRRIEAIAAVERKLAAEPGHLVAKEYRTVLYSQLTESEFIAAISPDGKPPQEFAYDFVEQLGLALVDDPDPDRRERGMSYLRMAGRGNPERAPGIYMKLAQIYEKLHDWDNRKKSLEMAKQVGQAVGVRNLPRDQRPFYFEALRQLADLADQAGDYETAIAELRQYQEDGGSAALETYRKLAELYGKTHDAMNALLMTETALTYDSTDADLLRKRDSFYYSVEPERLEQVKDRVAKWFDVRYCVNKAMAVLNAKDDSIELLDWATHLAKLARIMKPDSNGVRLVEARLLLRRGEREAGLKVLEDIHFDSPKGSGDEEEAWYTATKLLGQLYLDELGKPENALHCYTAYKEYYKSGADTLYQIARCYEAMGDHPHAIQFYNAVTAYEGHSLYWDAKSALQRLGKG